jgi:hypothetical protein
MTTDQVNAFVETAAIEAAYDAGVAAAMEIVESFLTAVANDDEAELLHDVLFEISTLHQGEEEMN